MSKEGQGSPRYGRPPSRRRQGARRCSGTATYRDWDCEHERADGRPGSCVGGSGTRSSSEPRRRRTRCRSRTPGRRRCDGGGADDADLWAGVPRGLRRASEADNQGNACAQHAAVHPPAFGNRRVDAVTARNVRNWFDDLSVTRAATCEPVVDGAVVPEEARRIFGAAAEGVEPLSRWWSTASRFAA